MKNGGSIESKRATADRIELDCDPISTDHLYVAAFAALTAVSLCRGEESVLFPGCSVLPAEYTDRDAEYAGGTLSNWDLLMGDIRAYGEIPYDLVCDSHTGEIYPREGTAVIALILAMAAGKKLTIKQIMEVTAFGFVGDRIIAGFLPGCVGSEVMNDKDRFWDHVYELCQQRMLDAGDRLRTSPPGVFRELYALTNRDEKTLDREKFKLYVERKYMEGKLLVGVIPTDKGLMMSVAVLPDLTNSTVPPILSEVQREKFFSVISGLTRDSRGTRLARLQQ